MAAIFILLILIAGATVLFFDKQQNNDYIEQLEEDHEETERLQFEVDSEVEFLKVLIKRRDETEAELEEELKQTTNEKRRQAIRRQLNTIDAQQYRDRRKIEKLKEKLESL